MDGYKHKDFFYPSLNIKSLPSGVKGILYSTFMCSFMMYL